MGREGSSSSLLRSLKMGVCTCADANDLQGCRYHKDAERVDYRLYGAKYALTRRQRE